ncbi:MAG: DoxX family protein [Verrucomicrobiota bacterium]
MNSRYMQWKQWSHSHLDVCVDLVRIYLGLGLMMKGYLFLEQKPMLMYMLSQNTEWNIPPSLVHLVPPVHLIGGAMLAMGLFTRLAAIVQLPILIGAVFFIYFPMLITVEGRQNFEFTALVLYLTLLFAIFGSGRLSLDHRLKTVPPHVDLCADMMRIYLGFGLFMKGAFFIEEREHLMQLIDSAGSMSLVPAAMAHYIIPVHIMGGILIMLGLLTRVAALANLPILIGATFFVFMPSYLMIENRRDKQDFEFTALVLFMTVMFTAFGAGRVSLDHMIEKDKEKERAAHGPAPAHA